MITAELKPGSGYLISGSESKNRTSIVVVLETLPVVSISVPDTQVREDVGSFNLVLETKTFTPDSGRPLNISGLTAVDTGTPNDYLGTIDLSAIEIGPSGRKVIQIPVTHNDTYRGWGEITFTLRDGQEYTANTEENKHIAKVTIAEAEVSTRKINVSAPDRVIEGENIEVMLTTTESLGAGESIAVEISVRASPSGFYNLDNSEQSPVTMTSASDEVTFNIATYDSIVLNQNGMIEISVIRGDQYEPATTTAEQVIIVAKETIPMVTITRISPSSIDEGEDAVFAVSASGVYFNPTNWSFLYCRARSFR